MATTSSTIVKPSSDLFVPAARSGSCVDLIRCRIGEFPDGQKSVVPEISGALRQGRVPGSRRRLVIAFCIAEMALVGLDSELLRAGSGAPRGARGLGPGFEARLSARDRGRH
jgi:hypothetical protein